MRIEWAVACRYIEVHDNLATMVGAGIDTTWVPGFPADVGLTFALRVAMSPGTAGEHPISCQVLTPDMEPAEHPPMEGMFGYQGQPHSQPGWEGHVIVPLAVRWIATQQGAYSVIFRVGDSSAEAPVLVVPATQVPGI